MLRLAATSVRRATALKIHVPKRGLATADPVLTAKPILERFSLKGRTGLVTGGGQGIGRAISHSLVQAGMGKISIVDAVESRAVAVSKELKRLYPSIEALPLA